MNYLFDLIIDAIKVAMHSTDISSYEYMTLKDMLKQLEVMQMRRKKV